MSAVVLMVLKVLGLTVLVLFGLVLLFLLMPVTADVLYEKGKVFAGVRLFGVRVALLPRRSKKKKAAASQPGSAKSARPAQRRFSGGEPAAAASADAAAPSQTDTAQVAGGALQQLRDCFDPAGRGIRFLLKHMRLHDVTFVFNVRSADAAEVGMRCGIMWTFVGGLMRTLAYLFGPRVKYGEVTVMPCFHPDDGARERFGCKITAAPIIIIIAAAIVWRRLNKQKKAAQ